MCAVASRSTSFICHRVNFFKAMLMEQMLLLIIRATGPYSPGKLATRHLALSEARQLKQVIIDVYEEDLPGYHFTTL
ncbi:hypothetical protein AB1Y20_019636 [Prymnesium parvum]|uniref:Uncharacterized protein n=1 Tax=Prymnesium parvum TaxID=97485 RepID=A0AB34JV07_PRYPA